MIAEDFVAAAEADAGEHFVAAPGEQTEHAAGVGGIGGLGEDLAGDCDGGIGGEDDLAGGGGDGAGLGLGEPADVGSGALGFERGLIHIGDADCERDSGVAQNFGAPRRLAGEYEHRYVELPQMKNLGKKLIVAPGSRLNLGAMDAGNTHGIEKAEAEEEFGGVVDRLSVLQYLLYAEGRRAVLVVLQGIDAGGKDGTIHQVMTGLNPQGVRVTSFKAPEGAEKRHDYLWRVHRAMPEHGQIGIFNRSHYEDVLIVRVHNLVPKSVWSERYGQINDFERMLTDNGMRIVKFLLYIDKDEQANRFRERIEDKTKNWNSRRTI